MLSTSVITGVSLLLIVLFRWLLTDSKRPTAGSRYPPGPKGVPFLGNLPAIPPKHSWFKFKEWSEQFGPLYRLNIVGRNHVIVSTEKIANDLLRDRGAIYSSREELPMAAKLLSDGLRIVFIPYNDLWRRERRLMHNLLNGPSATSSSQPTQLLESARLIHTLIDAPSNYEEITELYASSVVLRLTYAKSIKTGKEEFFRRVRVNAHNLERVASPGAYLVDSFPSLMYLPKFLAPFKREAERMHADELDLFRSFLRGAMGEKDTAPCYSRTWADTKDQYDLSFDQAAFVMGQLFEAGSVTTSAAMQSYILALIHYPQWQERIQAEVDTVVGESRMPTFDDVPNLPTVRAAVKESMRWRPVTAGGLPHRLTKDDVYDGFFLPEGTNVHPNQWAIHREPALYPDGETFNPDRWLDPKFPTYKEPLTVYPNLTNFSAFGFGRRICPGIALAERSLNIFAARLAWACHISKKRGVDGEEIEVPSYDYRAGFSTQPNNFPFDLRVRGEGRRRVVREEWEKERAADLLM